MKLEFCLVEDTSINQIKKYFNTLLTKIKEKSPEFDQKLAALKIDCELKSVKEISTIHTFLN